MGETTITIIAIFLAAILMFIFPLMAIAEQHDDTSQLLVQTYTEDLVNSATTKGKITRDDYAILIQKLGATGNTYDIEIEVQVLDENIGKKVSATSKDLVGENVYYSIYTTDVLSKITYDVGASYPLKKGDYVIVTVTNTNKTIATMLKDFVYTIVGKDTYQIKATYSSMVINNGN